MKDIMLDLETLATSTNSIVTQIGACYFDRVTGEIGEEFLVNINIKDSMLAGFDIDEGALKFWFEQPHHDFLKNPERLTKALELFRAFSKKAKCIWSHATFDFVILCNLYIRLGQKLPIHYSATRDIRTLVDLADTRKDDYTPFEGAHNALVDAKHQVGYCVKALNKLSEEVAGR